MLNQLQQFLRQALCGLSGSHNYVPSRRMAGYVTCEFCRHRKLLET